MGRFEGENYGIYSADRVAGQESLTPTRDDQLVISTRVIDNIITVIRFTIR